MSQKKRKKERKEKKQILEKGKEFRGIRSILKENWKFLIALCVGVFLIYFNSLWGDFVSDDYAAITQDPNVADVFGKITESFRSFPSVVNALVASVFGVSSSIPFHVLNLLMYMVVLGLLFLFLFVAVGMKLSMITVVIFSVLPVHVETVSWISGKPYLLNAMGVLWCLLLYSLYDVSLHKKYLYTFLVSLPFVFYFEPVRFAALILALPAYTLSLGQKKNIKSFFIWYFLLIFVAGFLTVFLLKGAILERVKMVNSGYNANGGLFYDPFFQYPTSIAKYLQLNLAPVDLTLYHTMYVFPQWLNWAISVVYLVCVAYFFFRNKIIFFGLSFILLATASSMAPVKVSWLVAERYVFLGSAGFALFLGTIFNEGLRKSKLVFGIIFGLMVMVYSYRVFIRNIDWQTNHNLWVNTCFVSPNSHNAWNNIGDDYDKLGQYENAVKGFSESTVVKPDYADAYHNRANIFFKMKRLDLARASYEIALHYSPGLFQTYFSLVQIDLMEKKYDLALAHVSKAVELQPNNPQSYYILGVVYAQTGNKKEAKNIFESILKSIPNYTPAREALNSL